jgi:membrane associated rhomboid family serine protease
VTPWVRRLLFANVVVFFVQMMAPGIVSPFVFVPVLILIRPWTIVTYMFLHGGFAHIFFNMLALYFFGPRVEVQLGSRRFAILYFLGGICGALLSFVLAPQSAIIGASAAVFGVMLAYAHFWPRDLIYIWGVLPIQARWLVIIATVISLYSGLGGSTGGVADFAHLGGFAGAFLYMKWLEYNTGVRKFQRHVAPKVADRTLSNWRRVDLKSVHEVNRDEVNRILDKISAKGIDSLTPQEKLFLSNFVPMDDRTPPVS